MSKLSDCKRGKLKTLCYKHVIVAAKALSLSELAHQVFGSRLKCLHFLCLIIVTLYMNLYQLLLNNITSHCPSRFIMIIFFFTIIIIIIIRVFGFFSRTFRHSSLFTAARNNSPPARCVSAANCVCKDVHVFWKPSTALQQIML